MRKKDINSIIFVLVSFTSIAQLPDDSIATHWTSGGVGAISLSQIHLSNWAAGGESSVSASGFFNYFVNYKNKRASWDNTLDIAYGLIRQNSSNPIKSDDKIDISSKYGRKAIDFWNYSFLFNFKTQMAPGYDYKKDSSRISDFLAPAYIIAAIGADYKPSNNFTLLLSPLTGKSTIVNDQKFADKGAFGVKAAILDKNQNTIREGEKVRNEFGAYLKTILKGKLMENINFQTKIELFTNYNKNLSNIDINWETLIALKVNKYISANISTNLIYDDDIDIAIDSNKDGIHDSNGPRTQFKEVFGIGFSYKF